MPEKADHGFGLTPSKEDNALCAEHERIAFFAGLQLGAQLMLELQQEAAGEYTLAASLRDFTL